jgi:hypothetical protein
MLSSQDTEHAHQALLRFVTVGYICCLFSRQTLILICPRSRLPRSGDRRGLSRFPSDVRCDGRIVMRAQVSSVMPPRPIILRCRSMTRWDTSSIVHTAINSSPRDSTRRWFTLLTALYPFTCRTACCRGLNSASSAPAEAPNGASARP